MMPLEPVLLLAVLFILIVEGGAAFVAWLFDWIGRFRQGGRRPKN
jgi:hypothetical protein